MLIVYIIVSPKQCIRSGVTDLYPSRWHTHPVTSVLAELSFDQNPFLIDLTAEVSFSFF